jgi:hypothetical protein
MLPFVRMYFGFPILVPSVLFVAELGLTVGNANAFGAIPALTTTTTDTTTATRLVLHISPLLTLRMSEHPRTSTALFATSNIPHASSLIPEP